MYTLKRRVYESLPLGLKKLACQVPFSLLAGRSYREVFKRSASIESASSDELVQFREVALRRILKYATNNVPAYKSLKAVVEELPAREALNHFPLIDKSLVNQNLRDFVSDNKKAHSYWESTTGGTSGEQLRFYLDNDAQSREMAFIHRLWARVGYSASSSKATFRGVALNHDGRQQFWQDNPVYNERQFSAFHLSQSTVDRYINAIREYQPQFVHGYPSSIGYFAALCEQEGISLNGIGIRAVLLGSEAVMPTQREVIEHVFGARVFSWYGHSERLILAGECEKSSAYHHLPDFGFLEIITEQGNEATEGEYGELVGTGYWNYVMPLIRYRSGDIARRLGANCECGRQHERFDQVEGRWAQEYVVGRNGSFMSLAALNMHGAEWRNVLRYQYVQEIPGIVELRLMVTRDFCNDDSTRLVHAFQKRAGTNLEVIVHVVDDIPLTARGKLRRLEQRLSIETAHSMYQRVRRTAACRPNTFVSD